MTAQDTKQKPGYKQTEVGVIPEDWEVKTLGEIASVSSGGTPDRLNPTYWDGDVPWVTTTQINFNLIDKANEFITRKGLENSAARIYNPGTLLMAMYGQGKTRGKVAVMAKSAAINQACAAIKLNKGISSKYVFFNLSARYEEIRSLSNTGNQENLNATIIKSILIPIPKEEKEQRAIVTTLSDVDALIKSLDRLIAKKRDIKQATMQQLLSGKMRLLGFSEGWTLYKFEQIATVRKEKVDPRRSGGHSFCVELEHIGQGSGRLIGYSAATEDSSLKSRFNIGDVLFGRLRAYLRKYWLADRDGVCSTEIWPFVPKSDVVIGQYLFQLIQANQFIEVASTAYGTHMPRTDWNVIKNYEVSLPFL